MKTLAEVLQLSADYLQKRGVERSRRQAEELLSLILKMPRMELYMQFDRPIVEAELVQLREVVKRRGEGEPWQYIAGEVEFLGCPIRVNPSVLIPRHETEILADQVMKALPSDPLEIWDLCTGSGCLGISIKKQRPDCHVVLSDISSKALEVARENAALNQVRVEVIEGDLLTPFQGRKAHIVVCNPPYISEKDYRSLDREVREWEPRQALLGGSEGLEFYQRLALQLPSFLQPKAKVFFEIGTEMGERVKNLFDDPIWKEKRVLQDWSSHDRYLALQT